MAGCSRRYRIASGLAGRGALLLGGMLRSVDGLPFFNHVEQIAHNLSRAVASAGPWGLSRSHSPRVSASLLPSDQPQALLLVHRDHRPVATVMRSMGVPTGN